MVSPHSFLRTVYFLLFDRSNYLYSLFFSGPISRGAIFFYTQQIINYYYIDAIILESYQIMTYSVLVLNANFEPINVCDLRRAFGLILSQKATLVINGHGKLHTINNAYSIPSVIRLQRMIHRPRIRVNLSRKEVFRRDHYTCQYCGQNSKSLTIDHVIPRHLGGRTAWDNIVTACPRCNHQKGGRTLQDSGMELLREPTCPPQSAEYIFGHHLNQNYEWLPFLEGW